MIKNIACHLALGSLLLGSAFFVGCKSNNAMMTSVSSPTLENPVPGNFNQFEKIKVLIDEGEFLKAEKKIKKQLKKDNLTEDTQFQLKYELERIDRIRSDYKQSREEIASSCQKRIKDVTDAEFESWLAEGRFDTKTIDGELRFMNASVSNLFFRYPELNERQVKEKNWKWESYVYQQMKKTKEETAENGGYLGKPRHTEIEMMISVDANTVPHGDLIRCWMPYPQQFQAQSDINLLWSKPEGALKYVNPPAYPQRSLYLETDSMGNKPTVFKSRYTLTTFARHYDIDPELVAQFDQTAAPEYEPFTQEQAPHVVFTDRAKALATEIVGQETNPAVKARLIYDWLAKNHQYSYAREYCTLRNISNYVIENGYGDCGQNALTFITLCRASGVPARWQSGWIIYPTFQNLHDWTEIYLAPYGWVPVDPDYGMEIYHYFTNLSEEQREELRDYYFGGLDAYRLVVNRQHGYPHYPAKEDFRSDNVDFQRGELEANGKNIYFKDFNYDLTATFLDEEEAKADKGEIEPILPKKD
jgi:transglutaminase-like putative cysteine protease